MLSPVGLSNARISIFRLSSNNPIYLSKNHYHSLRFFYYIFCVPCIKRKSRIKHIKLPSKLFGVVVNIPHRWLWALSFTFWSDQAAKCYSALQITLRLAWKESIFYYFQIVTLSASPSFAEGNTQEINSSISGLVRNIQQPLADAIEIWNYLIPFTILTI